MMTLVIINIVVSCYTLSRSVLAMQEKAHWFAGLFAANAAFAAWAAWHIYTTNIA